MTEEHGACRLEFNWLLSREFAPSLLLDAAFTSALELGRRGTGQPLHPLRVELTLFRAFREWEGTTPGEWKAARLTTA